MNNFNSKYEEKLNKIKERKKELLKNIDTEKEIVKYLRENDQSWYFFLKDNLIIEKEKKLSKEEYLQIKQRKFDNEYLGLIRNRLKSISKSNGSRFYEKMNTNIATVCDSKFYNTFKDTVNLEVVDPQKKLDITLYEALIISSFNESLCGEWVYNDKENNIINQMLAIVNEFHKYGKPVIFYDQRKDVNNYILEVAKNSDIIFTTTRNKLRYYHENNIYNVEIGSYTINPQLFNPIGIYDIPRVDGVLYEGDWENNFLQEEILDGVVNSDKNLKIIEPGSIYKTPEEYNYPTKYLKYISPLDGYTSKDFHKLYNYSIAFNDIERIYELQATGSIVISNYHPYINNNFPNVYTVDTQFEVINVLNSQNPQSMYQLQLEGVRNVMNNYTCYEKMDLVLNKVGINCNLKPRRVLVVGCSNKSREQFERQSYKNAQFALLSEFKNINFSDFDFLVYFNDNYFYEEYYLEDLLNGFKYTNSDFVAKNDKNDAIKSFSYINEITDIYKTMFHIKSFLKEDIISQRFKTNAYNGFCIDHLEVSLKKDKKLKESNELKELSVIVPIYNNGKFLEYKCFESLKRSSIFNKMEIIFVDDGSTDNETLKIVNRLFRSYDNIILYTFNDYGSGSASRPRNKGIELATCEYVTYLDPDNEAINDGYARLLCDIKSRESLDVVVGNISRYDSSLNKKEINYYNTAFKITHSDIVRNPKELLKKSNLKVQSIQALIAKKSLITDNNLKMVESAAGQDTLFFQELLVHANELKIVNMNIHVYYAAVDNSVTNTVSSNFYKKYYKVEKERIKFLHRHDLFDIYINKKFPLYFVNWYLKKLTSLKKGEESESLIILKKIYDMYSPYVKIDDDLIKMFRKYVERGRYVDFVIYCKENCK
ncbi:glycosyltransferase family 2 protein [Virgibacillus chiguensis]|uniref:Glycosyl transferase family 2 n=1 Tax=Virgibacillus chiguensis TaxID=411959 RepID=A0A1M5UE63_9BACI|nr:glycosyltransferase [Virgibacillus chiguensis]SHH61247.1 Glycosyl transferase family 2 [Virgibacillus chiguensis]